VIIHAYNQHVRLLSPEPMVLDKPQSTRVSGAGVVMQSSAVLKPQMSGNQALWIASEWADSPRMICLDRRSDYTQAQRVRF